MNDHLEEDLAAMLARRAATNRVAPDLDRVVAEAGAPDGRTAAAGTGGRGPYVLSLAAALIVVVGAGIFAIRSIDRTIVPTGEPSVSTSVPADEPVSTTNGAGTIGTEPPSPPNSDQPPLTPTHTFDDSTTTLGCEGPGPTNPDCGPDPDTNPDEEPVPTTLGCQGPGPTNPDCDGDPDTIFTRCFSDTTNTTRCCTPGTTTICERVQPPDPDPVPTQPQPTTPVDPADCVQVTTVPGCESLSTPVPTATPSTPGPVESVTISTTAPAG